MAFDWSAWSREAAELMQSRNDDWRARYELLGASYTWDLNTARLAFHRPSDTVVVDLCTVGTTCKELGTFLWSWANDRIPNVAKRGIEAVKQLGEIHNLPLLTDAQWPGGRKEGLEALAVAGRVLSADGVFIDETGDVTFFFALHRFRVEQPLES